MGQLYDQEPSNQKPPSLDGVEQPCEQEESNQDRPIPGSLEWRPTEPRRGLAIASLVLGVASLTLMMSFFPMGIISLIAAICTGYYVYSRACIFPWAYGGKGMALAGIIMGVASITITVTLFVFAAMFLLSMRASG